MSWLAAGWGLTACAGGNAASANTDAAAFVGMWTCSIMQSYSTGGGADATASFQFVENADGTVTSTESDDAGAYPCMLTYDVHGDTATIASGTVCVQGGVSYATTGSVTIAGTTLTAQTQYTQVGESSVGGSIASTCTRF